MDISGMSYLPLGEKRVVKALIENRSKIDPSFQAKMTDSDLYTSAGAPRLSENILVTYVSQDGLIEECGLSEKEMLVVQELMKGYCISDIAEHFCLGKSTCSTLFSRAVTKIIAWHDEVLYYTLHHRFVEQKRL